MAQRDTLYHKIRQLVNRGVIEFFGTAIIGTEVRKSEGDKNEFFREKNNKRQEIRYEDLV